jgi:hypothetical protein
MKLHRKGTILEITWVEFDEMGGGALRQLLIKEMVERRESTVSLTITDIPQEVFLDQELDVTVI